MISGSIQRLSDDGTSWEYLGQLAHPRFFHCVLPWDNSKLVIVVGASLTNGKIEALESLSIADMKTGRRSSPTAVFCQPAAGPI